MLTHSPQIITIQDNRKPVKPRSMRQSDVCMALMSLRAVVYGKDMESATVNQKNELGTAFSNLKWVVQPPFTRQKPAH